MRVKAPQIGKRKHEFITRSQNGYGKVPYEGDVAKGMN